MIKLFSMLDGIFTQSIYAISILSAIHVISIIFLVAACLAIIVMSIWMIWEYDDGNIDFDDEKDVKLYKTIWATILTTLVLSITGVVIFPSKTELIHMATMNYMRENNIPTTEENLDEYFDMFYNFLNKTTPTSAPTTTKEDND